MAYMSLGFNTDPMDEQVKDATDVQPHNRVPGKVGSVAILSYEAQFLLTEDDIL